MQAVLQVGGVERSHFWMSVWQQCEKRKGFLDLSLASSLKITAMIQVVTVSCM
jgi:hypothetical protein